MPRATGSGFLKFARGTMARLEAGVTAGTITPLASPARPAYIASTLYIVR